MKWHKVLIEAINHNLKQIFIEGKYADKVIEKCLKSNKKWGSRDRAFIAQTTYDCVRWMRLYDYCLKDNIVFEPKKLKDFYAIIAVHFILNDIDLPNWKEFDGLNRNIILSRQNEAQNIPQIKNSMPDWLHFEAYKQLGEKWLENSEALNQPADVVIRVNTLKTNTNELLNLLTLKKFNTIKINNCDNAILIKGKVSLFTIQEFKNGFFELQDANSQQVALFLNPLPGEKVIDACAGAGGKTLHMAALMQNKGSIVAMDTEKWKLDELRNRAARAGAYNIKTQILDDKIVDKYKGFADKLLLDVPCSGTGVFKRNPDTKWKLTIDALNYVTNLQQIILEKYCNMVSVNGIMVYATCSILPQENELQIKKFLDLNKNFQLIDEKILLPAQTGFDGFYMAKLIRKN